MGAITKRAQLPFSAWLPAAIAAPTPVSALVHSSTLVTAGVYLIIRLNIFFCDGLIRVGLIYLSVITIFISGLGANFETDLKKIIALSTLSQLGVIMMVLSVGYFDLAFFHLITHAVFKAILFLCAGVIIHGIGGRQDIRGIGLVGYLSPILSRIIGLASIALCGLPFMRGFYSKDMILEIIYRLNNNLVLLIMIILATMFTLIYSIRLMYYSLWRINVKNSYYGFNVNYLILNPIIAIAVFVVFLGAFLS
jgi:NADH-ubiquinone oxidoreductase chain 5